MHDCSVQPSADFCASISSDRRRSSVDITSSAGDRDNCAVNASRMMSTIFGSTPSLRKSITSSRGFPDSFGSADVFVVVAGGGGAGVAVVVVVVVVGDAGGVSAGGVVSDASSSAATASSAKVNGTSIPRWYSAFRGACQRSTRRRRQFIDSARVVVAYGAADTLGAHDSLRSSRVPVRD